jgi:hypothetical protein
MWLHNTSKATIIYDMSIIKLMVRVKYKIGINTEECRLLECDAVWLL